MATSSIYEILTRFSPDPYPSGDMIKSLIELLSGAVSSSVVAHSTHRLCTALTRSRDALNIITNLTERSLADNGDWASFNEYTKMIDPLEEYLLRLAIVTGENHIEQSTDITTVTDIQQWITAGATWMVIRETITDVFELLWTDERFKDVESTISAQDNQLFMNHDDDAFLNELIQGIGGRMTGNNARFSGSGWQRLEDVKKQIIHAQTLLRNRQVRENKSVQYLIHLTLIVNGIVEVISKTTNEESRTHLGSEGVLNQTLDIAKAVALFVEQGTLHTPTSTSLTEFEAKWQIFVNILITVSGNDASTTTRLDLGDLQKLPARIRPPYFLQSLGLVAACRSLIAKQAETSSQLNMEIVRGTVKVVVDAFKLAADLPPLPKSGSLSASLKSATVDNAYTIALDKVKESFTAFELNFNSEAMDTQKAKDNRRLTEWETKLAQAHKDAVGAAIEVTVEVTTISGTTMDVKVGVSETATLDTVLWGVCSDVLDKTHRERLRSGYFVGAGNMRLEVSELVSKIGLESGKGSVQLKFD